MHRKKFFAGVVFISHSVLSVDAWFAAKYRIWDRWENSLGRALLGGGSAFSGLHRGALLEDLYTEKEAWTQGGLYTQSLLHRETFTQEMFYTQELLHRVVFYTEKSLHKEVLTHRSLHTQRLPHLLRNLLRNRIEPDRT